MTEFKETQKMTQWWLWAILLGTLGVVFWEVTEKSAAQQLSWTELLSSTGLWIPILLPVAILVFFYVASLKTDVDSTGIRIRYFPMWQTHIPWEQVESAEITKYGFVEYGIRFSISHGTVYNVKGNRGLQLVKKNGSRILIGTQRPEELKAAVSNIDRCGKIIYPGSRVPNTQGFRPKRLHMERYITQLIEELQARHKPDAEPAAPAFEETVHLEKHFEEVERYLSGEHEQRISDVLDLIPEQFPPADRLTPEQLSRLVQAYQHLLFSWNISTDLPEGFPLPAAYPLLVGTLDQEVYLSDDGFVTIEFCTYDSPTCPYAETCRCDEKYKETDDFTRSDDSDDMPF